MKTLSFVIPVYNEENRLGKTMTALNTFVKLKGTTLAQVIFVNDGSTDDTLFLLNRAEKIALKSFKKHFPNTKITIVSYRNNQGKGFAIKQGMLRSTADYTLFFDADMSTPLSELKKFMPLMKRNIAVIVGTRKNGTSTVIMHQPLLRELLGHIFTKVAQKMLRVNATDFTCGFKAFSKEAKDTIFAKSHIATWGFDAEILYLTQKHTLSWKEQAVVWSNDPNTKVTLFTAVPQTLLDLILIRWYHEIEPFAKTIKPTLILQLRQVPLAGRITSMFL